MSVRQIFVSQADKGNVVSETGKYSQQTNKKNQVSSWTEASNNVSGRQADGRERKKVGSKGGSENMEMSDQSSGKYPHLGNGGKYDKEGEKRAMEVEKKRNENKKEINESKTEKDVTKAGDPESNRKHPGRPKGWKMFLHVFLFLFMFGNDLADFISDWLFFVDVKMAEKGLVYGPPEPAAVWLLLVFSIIGTFTFCFECTNLWWEFFRNNPWLDSDWLSAIVIWIEDVPQVAISLHLALCREEPISVFQLTKAAVILIGVVVRIVITSVKYCNKQAVRSHYHVKIKVVIMLGIILEAMGAGAIFFVTQTERGTNGDVSFRIPSTVIEDSYNDQRYFTNVSVFVNQADVFDAGNLDTNKADPVVNWLHLASVYSIREGYQGILSFKIDYDNSSSNTINLAVSERKQDNSNWALSECYNIDKNTGLISNVSNTTCALPGFLASPVTLFIKFQYESPGSLFKKKVFGDIHVNMMKLENGTCTPLTRYADSVADRTTSNGPLTLHYYRTNETLNYDDVKHLLYKSGSYKFFRNDGLDMSDVSSTWKTGWRECDSNGNTAPIYDADLELMCS